MLSWGELWDKKEDLALKLTFSVTSDELAIEKNKVQKLIESSSLDDLYELEVRAQAVLHGLVATSDQIKEGSQILDEEFFPGLSSSLTAAGNTCHDEQGRFCETHGVVHNETDTKKKKGWLSNALGTFLQASIENSQPIQHSPSSVKSPPKPAPAPEPTTAMVPQKVTLPSSGVGKMFGGSPKLATQQQINDEIKNIKTLADKSEKSKWSKGGGMLHDRVEASVRSTALAAGRIASKDEVEKAYTEHQRRVASGMLVGGLIVHHFTKK